MSKPNPKYPYTYTCEGCHNTFTTDRKYGRTVCPGCVRQKRISGHMGAYNYVCSECHNTITQTRHTGATICGPCKQLMRSPTHRVPAKIGMHEKGTCACGKPIFRTSTKCRSCATSANNTTCKFKAETFICQRCHNTFRLAGNIANQKYCRDCAHDLALEDMQKRNDARRKCSVCGGKIIKEGTICSKCGDVKPSAPKQLEITLLHEIADLPMGATFCKNEVSTRYSKLRNGSLAASWIPNGSEWLDSAGTMWKVKDHRFEVVK
jgi:hypothetical protein